MKDGDGVQVQPIQVKSTEWLLRDKVKDLKKELKQMTEKWEVRGELLEAYREDYSACFKTCADLRKRLGDI
jgi:hypothetical protein